MFIGCLAGTATAVALHNNSYMVRRSFSRALLASFGCSSWGMLRTVTSTRDWMSCSYIRWSFSTSSLCVWGTFFNLACFLRLSYSRDLALLLLFRIWRKRKSKVGLILNDIFIIIMNSNFRHLWPPPYSLPPDPPLPPLSLQLTPSPFSPLLISSQFSTGCQHT